MDRAYVSVLGSGLVHSLGGKQQLRDLIAGKNVSLSTPDITPLSTLLTGKKNLRRMPRNVKMALLAALQAVEEASWSDKDLHSTALVLGTAYGGTQMTLDFMDSILDNGTHLASPTAFSHSVNNMYAGLLSLALGLEGPCQTVSQFEFSFAGALEVAETLLASGRVDRVLLGAADELDARFIDCCPQLQAGGLPLTEGAIFFCLERVQPKTTTIRLRWDLHRQHELNFYSGLKTPLLDEQHQTLYGYGPLAHALDTLWALQLIKDNVVSAIDCICTAASSEAKASIEVRSGI